MRRLLVAATAALLTAQAQSIAQAQTVTLDFPSWQATEPGTSDWYKKLIGQYEASHPGVKINFYPVPFAQYVDTLTKRFAAGNPPDIVHLPSFNFGQFADQGWLAPLDDLIKGTDIASTFVKLQNQAMKWEGKTYGLLVLGYGQIMWYNDQLLKQAGVTVPKTPEALLAALPKLTDTAKGQYGISLITTQHANLFQELITWVAGQGIDWTRNGKYTLTSSPVLKAVNQYRQALQYSPKGIDSEKARQLFVQGKTAIIFQGPWMAGYVNNADAAVKPHLKSTRMPFLEVVGGTSNNLALASGTSADKRKLAWDFLTLVASPAAQRDYATMTASPPARNGVLATKTLSENPFLNTAVVMAKEAVDYFPDVKILKSNAGEFRTLFNNAIVQLITTTRPTEQVMADLQKQLEQKFPIK